MIKRGVILGLISGLVLGLLFKGIQAITKIKIYTLLLNVDFIPVIGLIKWHELIEFSFHLIISFAIGIVFTFIVECNKLNTIKSFWLALALTFPTFFLYFPLSYLAVKEVTKLNDLYAFSLWVLGHILYAIALWYSFEKLYRKRSNL